MKPTEAEWRLPPRMEDLAELARVAATIPMEAEVRLEALRRELLERIEVDPMAVANFAFILEQARAMQHRQLNHALQLLAERQTCIEIHRSRDREQRAEIERLQGLAAGRRRWWRPW